MLFSIYLKKHLQMCFRARHRRLSTIKRQTSLQDEEPLQSKDMQKPDLETLVILGADLAVVLTCPQKLAHKLQGEEASPEDQPGKY